jgi:hypothetical protein
MGFQNYLLESRVLEFDTQPPPPLVVDCNVQYTLYTEHYAKFWDSSFEFAEYIKPIIQRRHLFADLRLPHLCSSSHM